MTALKRAIESPVTWTIAAGLIFALRWPQHWTTPQLWAEDGGVFFIDALTQPMASLLQPVEGYLHLNTRLLALSALVVPLAWVPATYTAIAFAGTLAAMAYVATARVPAPAWYVSPLALAIVPHNGEIAFGLANLQWIGATCLALAAAAPPAREQSRRRLDLAVVALCGLNGPFSLLFLPAFALRAWVSRDDAQARALLAIAALTAAVQAAFIMNTGVLAGARAWPGLGLIVQVLIGNGIGDWFAFNPRPSVPWGFVALAGLIVALAAPLRRPDLRPIILALGLCGGAILAAALYKSAADLSALRITGPYGPGARFFYPPGVFLAWSLWMAAWSGWLVSRAVAFLCLSLLVANAASRSERIPRPDQGWREQIRRFEAGGSPVIRILPPGWIVTLPRRER